MRATYPVTALSSALGVVLCSACSQGPATAWTSAGDDSGSGVASSGSSGSTDPSSGSLAAGSGGQGDASSATNPLGGWHVGDGGAAADSEAGALSVQEFSSSVGPIPVAAGQEATVCITIRMTNPDAIYVPRITANLAPGSHHLVVYRSNATTEAPTPTPCTAFQGVLNGTAVPMLIAQTPQANLTFPQGVALKLAPQQMIMLEAHYINAGSQELQGQGSVTFESLPATTPNIIESDFGFYGTLNIAIPPNSKASVGPLFVTGLAGTHGFALTTHQHRLGARFRIWYANSASDTNHPPVADTTDWSNAPLYMLSPQLDFNGQNGLAYQCEWNNTTSSLITFGESALQEMCFLWMYYYPSHGFDMRTQ